MLFAIDSTADTVNLKNGEKLRGLILDEYRDRVVLSTPQGELVILKENIASAAYDSEERSLLRKADNLYRKGQYIKAYYAYANIVELNPEQNEARQRLNYLRNFIEEKTDDKFRGRSAKKILYGESATQTSSLDRLKDTYGIVLTQEDKYVYVESINKTYKNRYFKALKPGDRIVKVWGEMSVYMDAREVAELMLNSEQVKLEVERNFIPKLGHSGSFVKKIIFGYRSVIGAKLVLRQEGIRIYGLVKGGPFSTAGVKKGDLLCQIVGKSTRYMPMAKVVGEIMAFQGKDFEIVIRRELSFWRKG